MTCTADDNNNILASTDVERRSPSNNDNLHQRIIALQQSVGNLAQLDLQKLATLLPAGTSLEQVQQIKLKLVQLNQLQQQQHRKLERSVSEPNNGSSDGNESLLNSSRYKTELCRPFEENGTCKYGDKCQFAHGSDELRSLARHPKYKTELCRTFHTTGLCPYGPRCHFIHNADEAKRTQGISSAVSQEALNMKMLQLEQQRVVLHRLQQDLPSQLFKNRMHALRPKALSIGCARSLGSAGELSPPISPAIYDDPFTPSYFNMPSRISFSEASSIPSSASSTDIPIMYPSPPSLGISPLAAMHASSLKCSTRQIQPQASSYQATNKPFCSAPMAYSASFGDQLMSAPAVITKSETIFNFPPALRTGSPPVETIHSQLNSLSISSTDIAGRTITRPSNNKTTAALPRLPVFDQFSRRLMTIS